MDYIKIEDATKFEVMKLLSGITSSGKLVDKTFEFIAKHKNILDANEYIKISASDTKTRKGAVIGLIFNCKYSIHVKRTTIILIMALLDAKFGKGLITTGIAISGFPMQTIHKIQEVDRCILLDIMISNKFKSEEFLYYGKECVQNNIICPYRNDGICSREISDVRSIIRNLKEKDIINIREDGCFKIAF